MTLDIRYSYRSPNYNSRGGAAVTSLCAHTTEGWWDSDLDWLCSASSGVSAHYVISPDGVIYEIVSPAMRAWHAGSGAWYGCSDLNTISIGVEISHVQGQPYGPNQWLAFDALGRLLIEQYPTIQQYMCCAHRWYAPSRKTDPTDYSDSQMKAFFAGLFSTYAVFRNATVDMLNCREGPGTQYPVALDGLAQLAPGQQFEVDDHTPSDDPTHPELWLHSVTGIGFVYSPLCEQVS